MAFSFPFIQLLGVHPWVLLEALTHRKIEAKTEEVKMALGGNVPALPTTAASRMVALGEARLLNPAHQVLCGPASVSISCLNFPIPQHPTITSSLCLTLALPSLHRVFAYAVPSAGTLFPMLLAVSPASSFSSQGSFLQSPFPAHPTPTLKHHMYLLIALVTLSLRAT